MPKLFMLTGLGSAIDLASGKKGAFYNTLEEFHRYWERIDIIVPKTKNYKLKTINYFNNVFIHVSPWPLFFHPFWFIKKALEIYREQKFDLMTVHEFPPFYNGIVARILWHFIKVPYVLEIFHIPGYPKSASTKERLYKIIFSFFIKFDAAKAKAVRVMNKKQVPDFLKKSGVPESKIVYIPAIYIDLNIFRPTNLPKEYDLIFVGRLEKNKGLDLLLDAFKTLNTKYEIQNTKLLIVGSGPLAASLKFKIENLKLRNNVLQYGWAKDQAEIAELINKSKILVVPSYNEGGPRVVLEAMACGVPVLATSVGLIPDLGSAVMKIDWDSGDIAKKAKFVLGDQAEYMRLKQEGLEIVKQFEKKAAIKNYAEKLKKFIDTD